LLLNVALHGLEEAAGVRYPMTRALGVWALMGGSLFGDVA
jgi:hypothetical protein